MSQEKILASSEISDDKEKIVKEVATLESNPGFCDIAHLESLHKKNDELISAILQHARNTESFAC